MDPQRLTIRRRAAVCVALVALAAIAAVIPLPALWVERWYSQGFYVSLQSVLTPLSNVVPIFLVDIGGAVLLATGIAAMVAHSRRNGWKATLVATSLATIAAAAALYLVFLFTWGLNYRRMPLEEKLAYDSARVSKEAALRLGRITIQHINQGHGPAHNGVGGPSLEQAFADALRAVGQRGVTAIGRPKRSLLSLYFRYAAIDGMTDPIFLDILINPEVLPMERPEVLTHEWAHLAGYADEAEANFIAWLACVRGDAMAQYSGWLSLYRHVAAALPIEDRRALAALLADGPRADLRAMAARYERGSRIVQSAQRGVYDVYLRANRTEEGIERYNAVTKLVLGTEFDVAWNPRRR